MADIANLEGSSSPGAVPDFTSMTDVPAPALRQGMASPDADLLALVAEARVATLRVRALGEQRDAACKNGVNDPAYRAANDAWSASLDELWAFWPRIAGMKATTVPGWMAKASTVIETPDELAEYRADPSDLGDTLIENSLTMDIAEAFFNKQAEGNTHVPPSELDAPIIKVWKKRHEAYRQYEAARDEEERVVSDYVQRGSALAEIFRAQNADFRGEQRLSSRLNIDQNGFYTAHAVNLLRAFVKSPSTHQQRAAEIIEAYDNYSAPSLEREEAERALKAATAHLHSFDATIRDTPALSLEGIGIKASWGLTITACGERDHAEILRQVEAFARRHRKPARAPDVPHLERDAMGGLPAADWALYHLFVRWLESATEYRSREAEEEATFDAHGSESEIYQAARAAAEAEEVENRALRLDILEMPAASAQGVQLKAMVYHWLCRGMEEINDRAKHASADGPSDEAFAIGIARDLARLGAPAVLCNRTGPLQAEQVEERAA